jgi:ABC-2 type transport system permease protein
VKKTSLIDSLKSRKFRFGGYATLLIVGALAVVIAINVLVDQIPGKLDLTQNRIYSLSPETYKVLEGLKTDLTITTIGKPGQEDATVKTILAKYAARSRHVKMQTIDPEMNPGWTKQYDATGQGLSAGTLVVASGAKYKNIGVYDMYNYDTSNYNPMDPNSQPRLTSLSVEQRVTSAVLYVTAEKNVTIYVLQGHGEQTLDSLGLSTPIANENYAVKSLNFLTTKAVPDDANIVLVMAPKNDLSTDDAEKLRAYLAGGGRAEFLFDVFQKDNEFPHIADLLKTYGIEVRGVVVVEGDTNKVATQNPAYIIPSMEYHDINSPLRANSYDVVLAWAQSIQTLDLKKKSLKIEPLLTSSSKSYGKRDIQNATSAERQAGDLSGPFTLAVAVTDPASEAGRQDTQIVVIGNIRFLAQSIASAVPGNGDFFMNSLGWLKGQKESLTIRPKSLQQMRLTISSLWALIFSGVVVILLPLLILGSGFAVWMRRRHL